MRQRPRARSGPTSSTRLRAGKADDAGCRVRGSWVTFVVEYDFRALARCPNEWTRAPRSKGARQRKRAVDIGFVTGRPEISRLRPSPRQPQVNERPARSHGLRGPSQSASALSGLALRCYRDRAGNADPQQADRASTARRGEEGRPSLLRWFRTLSFREGLRSCEKR